MSIANKKQLTYLRDKGFSVEDSIGLEWLERKHVDLRCNLGADDLGVLMRAYRVLYRFLPKEEYKK